MRATISYGKAEIGLYRTYARPLEGLAPIPESAFTGRPNTLFAAEVTVEVFGDNFLPAYTEGDNSGVVATDTMKNFVLQQGLAYEGATFEGFLRFLGLRFLATYPQMRSLRLTARERPFRAASVPRDGGAWGDSGVLFARAHDDYAVAVLEIERDGDGERVTGHRCGRHGLQLIKITGSSFAAFVRDAYTTLPERKDRPLFIYLDVGWKYVEPDDMVAPDLQRYIPAEQVRDVAQAVFHEFVSMSIQHLVHEMGTRLLARFPQMTEVSFAAQNRLWDTAYESASDPTLKVYTDPRPPYGMIGLTLTREETNAGGSGQS